MTYYELLGVSKSASQEEIKSAYKKLIKKYHPDIYPGDKTFAEKKTKEINEAYDTLSDTNKKNEYDLSITPSSYNQTYNYTPPKYSSDYNPYSTYSKYTNTSSKENTSYSNSNINNSSKVDKREVIYDELAKKLGANMAVVLVIFAFYLIIFIATLVQYKFYQKKHTFNDLNYNNTSTNTLVNDYHNNYENKEFDINTYLSDDDLLKIYNSYYSNDFDSFDEFKEAFSSYIKNYIGI